MQANIREDEKRRRISTDNTALAARLLIEKENSGLKILSKAVDD